ncbi:MAG: hypothetical protein RCG15_07790 [Candidatus Rickettsia vulgarisii]
MLISQQDGLILHYKQLLIKSLKNMTLHHQIAIMQQLMPLIIKAGSKERN